MVIRYEKDACKGAEACPRLTGVDDVNICAWASVQHEKTTSAHTSSTLHGRWHTTRARVLNVTVMLVCGLLLVAACMLPPCFIMLSSHVFHFVNYFVLYVVFMLFNRFPFCMCKGVDYFMSIMYYMRVRLIIIPSYPCYKLLSCCPLLLIDL